METINCKTTLKSFFQEPKIVMFGPIKEQLSFYIHVVAYNDFNIIKPILFPRRQKCHTLHFILQGSGTLNIRGKQYKISQNDVFYIDDKTMFYYYPDNDEPWEYVYFEFYGNSSEDYASSAGFNANRPFLKAQNPQKITGEISALFNKKLANCPISYFELLSLFFNILDSVTEKTETKLTTDDYIAEIKYFIQTQYLKSDLDINAICNFAHISHPQLCRIFKKYEKTTVIEYIMNLRLEYAKNLILNTSYNIYKISIMSGYKTYSYFLKQFKKKTSLTPVQFREKYKDNTNAKLNI